jgi:3-oxoacyl-[acyl-carrier protein] reductase
VDGVTAADGSRPLAGRVALVTGASGGIGAQLSLKLAGAGAAVALHYASSADPARGTAESIETEGGRAATFGADLGDPASPARLVDDVERELGPVDVVASNAGLGRRASWEEVDAGAFDEMVAVNLRAPFLLARRALPGMRQRSFGRILFTSSVAALTGGIVGPHYAASKAGLHALTHHLASRVAADGVTVNAIAPALIQDTGMLPGNPTDLARSIPVGRLGTPEEVADLALAMILNGYLTSKVVTIDGGLYAR